VNIDERGYEKADLRGFLCRRVCYEPDRSRPLDQADAAGPKPGGRHPGAPLASGAVGTNSRGFAEGARRAARTPEASRGVDGLAIETLAATRGCFAPPSAM